MASTLTSECLGILEANSCPLLNASPMSPTAWRASIERVKRRNARFSRLKSSSVKATWQSTGAARRGWAAAPLPRKCERSCHAHRRNESESSLGLLYADGEGFPTRPARNSAASFRWSAGDSVAARRMMSPTLRCQREGKQVVLLAPLPTYQRSRNLAQKFPTRTLLLCWTRRPPPTQSVAQALAARCPKPSALPSGAW